MWDQIWPWICLSPYGWKTVLLEKHQRPWFKSTTKPRGSHLLNVYFWMYFIALWIENNSSGKTPKVPWFKGTTKPLGSHLLNVYFWMCLLPWGWETILLEKRKRSLDSRARRSPQAVTSSLFISGKVFEFDSWSIKHRERWLNWKRSIQKATLTIFIFLIIT